MLSQSFESSLKGSQYTDTLVLENRPTKRRAPLKYLRIAFAFTCAVILPVLNVRRTKLYRNKRIQLSILVSIQVKSNSPRFIS
jgi:hypothetical protein